MDKKYNVFSSLDQYIRDNKFKGYDPYDTLNSWIPFEKFGRWVQIIFIQIQKRNPINIRRLIGIKKFQSTKGSGLLLNAYLNIYSVTKNEKYVSTINFLTEWLINNQTSYKGAMCWGYDYPYTDRSGGRVEKGYPTIIHHSYIIKGFFNHYKIFGDERIYEILMKSKDFVVNVLKWREFDEGICFNYDPNAKGCCYNASIHAAESLARVYHHNREKDLFELIVRAVDFVTAMQQEDGSWYYSFEEYGGEERKQIDFHQGFILESYIEIISLIDYDKETWQNSISKGMNFYYKEQFNKSGRSLWRLPSKFPIDIHNQAQGIITFSKLNKINSNYNSFANTICDWTIDNMYNVKKGYFYYRIYKTFVNRISYMRWSQSWMLLALSELIIANSNQEHVKEN